MPAIKFDGVGDSVTCGIGACNSSVQHTLIVVSRMNVWSTWKAMIDDEGASAGQVRASLEIDSGANPASLSWSSSAQAAVGGSSITQVSSLTAWYGLAAAKAANSTMLFRRDLTANAAAANETNALTSGLDVAGTRVVFGLWNATDDFNGWTAAAAWFNSKLTAAQLTECFANRRTSDIWNCSVGRPAALWELNVAPSSVVDLTGNGANWSSTQGNPTLDNAVTPDWTFDGTGAVATTPTYRPRGMPMGV